MNVGSVKDDNYLVPGGVERLVLQWKVTSGRIDKHDGVSDEEEEGDSLHPEFQDLLNEAGSAKYKRGARPEGMDRFEEHNLLYTLAPYEMVAGLHRNIRKLQQHIVRLRSRRKTLSLI